MVPNANSDATTQEERRPGSRVEYVGVPPVDAAVWHAPKPSARVMIRLTALLRRFPGLALAVAPQDVGRAPDGDTWRLASLSVTF